jgi:hypothetical protein
MFTWQRDVLEESACVTIAGVSWREDADEEEDEEEEDDGKSLNPPHVEYRIAGGLSSST